ncbi:outer membrane protein with beta-barrel domain [Chitinophaga skermanii]|uniref:Outer membrane protein with beta-barrel domain n=1 Tax=Chitinophaga skermanii TaxID=331697 RepID=A0A327Q6B1_9BACT|nr:outer membrane beta-barrel protein [Chitinophaga skermanii]RAI99810.1 outer membrane protein with beta-barrel domain [Chitinophaga skermanii]
MKKIHLLTLAVFTLFISSTAFAQTQKGNIMVGASLGNITGTFSDGSDKFQININPKVGWFIKDNLALGVDVNLGYAHTSFDNDSKLNDFNYGIGAFGRYYISDKSIEFSKRSRFFFEANAGFAGTNSKTKTPGGASSSSNTNGLALGFGPGLAYFITPNVGLEALLKYDVTVGFGSSTTVQRLGLNVGFQIYLPSKRAKELLRAEQQGK